MRLRRAHGARRFACLSPTKDGEVDVLQYRLWADEPLKRCSSCRELKPLEEYHRNRAKPDGLQARCRTCNIALNRQWYSDHPEAAKLRMYARERRIRNRNRRQIVEYLLEHPCVDCGEADPVVLDFDHMRDKLCNVSFLTHTTATWARILEEISKCEVRCANCHRRRTAERADSFRHRFMRELVDASAGLASSVTARAAGAMVARRTFNPQVPGSSPGRPTHQAEA